MKIKTIKDKKQITDALGITEERGFELFRKTKEIHNSGCSFGEQARLVSLMACDKQELFYVANLLGYFRGLNKLVTDFADRIEVTPPRKGVFIAVVRAISFSLGCLGFVLAIADGKWLWVGINFALVAWLLFREIKENGI